MTQPAQSPKAPAILKAARVIAAISESPTPLSTVELSQNLSIPKSSVVDLCQTLADLGCLRREPHHRFALGNLMPQLSRGLFEGHPLPQLFYRVVRTLKQAEDRTIFMAVLRQSDIAVVAVHHGRSVLPMTAKPGLYLPAWTSAAGYSLLSEHSQSELETLLANPTVTGFGVPGQQPSPQALYKKIQATKAKGYFVEQEQTAIGMCGVSAPIMLPGCETPIASVCMATAGSRLDDAEEQILGQIARTIALRCAS